MGARIKAVLGLALAATLIPVAQAEATTAPVKYKSCKALNAKYHHGVGLKGAKDKTTGVPVRNFTINRAVYLANYKLLDRDRDGIACEKR